MLREVAKEVIEGCKKQQKHLVIEELAFVYKKQQMKYKNKVINAILSSFAYTSNKICKCIKKMEFE